MLLREGWGEGGKVDDKSKLVKKLGYYEVGGSQLLMAQLVELVDWILLGVVVRVAWDNQC